MHNTISSFVPSLISKHPYPYFNLNTITSAADILSVDSYMSIYAWSGYERIRTPTPSFRTVQPNFRLVLGIPFYKYWLYQFVYISKNYKSLSPLISTTTSDNTDMQHSLLTFHLKYLRRSYVASPTAFLNLGLLYISKHLTFHYRVSVLLTNISTLSPHRQRKSKVIFHTAISLNTSFTIFSWLYQDILPLNHQSHTYMIPSRTRTDTFLITPSVSFRCL